MSAICRILVMTITLLSFHTASAGMIGAPQAADAQRSTVISVIERADVSRHLQGMGLEPQAAKDRVAALTDEEVRALSGKLDTLPAGGISDWWRASSSRLSWSPCTAGRDKPGCCNPARVYGRALW